MADRTKIEWCDATWSPITGCTKISPGCANCYAERMSKRLAGRCGYPKDEPFRVTLHPDKLEQPFRWRKPRRIFVCSMGDLFHDGAFVDYPDGEFIDKIFAVMAFNPQHTFQLLTKRAGRMMEYLKNQDRKELIEYSLCEIVDEYLYQLNLHDRAKSLGGVWFDGQYGEYGRCEIAPGYEDMEIEWPLPNVHIGVTAENQEMANERIPLLLQTPAAKRFVSCEPLLGPIDLDDIVSTEDGWEAHESALYCDVDIEDDTKYHGATLDQVIVGAETGPGKRPMNLDWARDIRDQCQAAKVPFFFKKDSEGNHELDGRVWEEQ